MTHPWLASYPEDINWAIKLDPKPLYSIIDEACSTFANNCAIDFLGKEYSYSTLGKLIDQAADGLQKNGVKKGVNVGLMLPNCPYYIISYFAILKAGGTVVNYNPMYALDELEHQIEDSHTDIMITLNVTACYPKLGELLPKTRLRKIIVGKMQDILPFPKNILFSLFKRKDIVTIPDDNNHIMWNDLLTDADNFTPTPCDPQNDIAILQYTGGTTGVPKGAALTHHNVYSNAVQCGAWFSQCKDGEEVMLGVLPFFHVFAMTVVMNFSLLKGAKIILHPRFVLEDVIKAIETKKPTLMPGVPTMFVAINNYANIDNCDLSSLRSCLSGGAPLPIEVKKTFEAKTGCTVVEGYGLTESSPVAAANPIVGKNKAGSIGLPFPATEIKILSTEEEGKWLGIAERGEICILGPQVMKGYWNNKQATDDTMFEGALRTGDIGYIDDEGYVFIVDRLKELIIAGGFNIYPRHVEEAIYEHPAILEAAVIGIPDDYRGQTVKAYIALKEGQSLSEDELLAHLKDKLAKYELPTHIEFRDSLPKTMIGKISKKDL